MTESIWTKVPSGTGAGGGFGTTAPNAACAIADCGERGRPQQCPYDGAHHRHGMVHYWCGSYYKANKERFREGWHLLCATHFKEISEHDAGEGRR